MWRKVCDVLFWLGVSAYFGGMLILGLIVAPSLFKVAKDPRFSMSGIAPILELDRQIGGEFFGLVMNRFGYVEAAALVLVLAALIGWTRIDKQMRPTTWALALLWAVLAAIAAYDIFAVRMKVYALREEVRKTALVRSAETAAAASQPESAPIARAEPPWPERVEFDALHKKAEELGRAKVYVLLAMLAAGAWYGTGTRRETPSKSPAKSVKAS